MPIPRIRKRDRLLQITTRNGDRWRGVADARRFAIHESSNASYGRKPVATRQFRIKINARAMPEFNSGKYSGCYRSGLFGIRIQAVFPAIRRIKSGMILRDGCELKMKRR